MKSQRTKTQLGQALKDLVSVKPLDKISIKEITDSCHMNRQTFYYHFEDIYDLMEWLLQKEAFSIITQHQGSQLWERGVKDLFKYLHDNKAFCRNSIKALGNEYLYRFFYDDLYQLVYRTIDDLRLDIPISDDEIAFTAQYHVLSFASLLTAWISGVVEQEPEELCAYFQQLIEDQMRGVGARYGAPLE